MQDTKNYALIGTPLSHSRSPLLHNAFFEHLQYNGSYKLCEVYPEGLGDFMRDFRKSSLEGLSVTIPHKVNVMSYLDEISPLAKSVGAVNTVYRHGDMLCGDNTDVYGFLMPLRLKKIPNRALVLGGGGAARAVVVGLKTLRSKGMNKIFVSARTAQRAEKLCEEFQCVFVPWEERTSIKTPWIINTTPLGMQGLLEGESPFPSKALKASAGKSSLAAFAYDLIYNPLQTRFLTEAAQAGFETEGGLSMFLGQAIGQQKLWLNDQALPLEQEDCIAKMQKLIVNSL